MPETSPGPIEPRCWWAVPDDARHYDPALSVDRHGAHGGADARDTGPGPRRARRELEWRVSRAALQAARATPTVATTWKSALTHSGGHAVVGLAPADWLIGVDLEERKPRRFRDMADWFCDADEAACLDRLGPGEAGLRHFYRLWTVKEALIKACDEAFPAALTAFGLWPRRPAELRFNETWRLKLRSAVAARRRWQVCIHEDDRWTVCVALSPPDDGPAASRRARSGWFRWHAIESSSLPAMLSHPSLVAREPWSADPAD